MFPEVESFRAAMLCLSPIMSAESAPEISQHSVHGTVWGPELVQGSQTLPEKAGSRECVLSAPALSVPLPIVLDTHSPNSQGA